MCDSGLLQLTRWTNRISITFFKCDKSLLRITLSGHVVIQKHIDQYTIRVLVSKEDGEIVARALELDLLGYGATDEEAVNELVEAIDCQVSFARQQNQSSIILFPSPPEFFQRWEEAHSQQLKLGISGNRSDKPLKLDYRAVTLSLDLSQAPGEQVFIREPQQAVG